MSKLNRTTQGKFNIMHKTFLLLILFAFIHFPVSAQELNEMKGFKGLLGGKTAVEIVVSDKYNDGEWITAGYCYYPKAKTPAPILVVATTAAKSFQSCTDPIR